MEKIRIALDWTPNINHIGFFIAKEKGFFSDNNLAVEILDPSMDNYATTPAKKVELGEVDFALCPMESVISFQTKPQPFALKAIAAIFQEDLSAIAVRSSDFITSPKDLDGKTYASYKARYEDEIVKQMIRNDGGEGLIEVVYPEKLGIWETIVKGTIDSTWIFLNWEGVEAKSENIPLTYFKMRDFGIPYSYSPVLVASEQHIKDKSASYKKFLNALKRGYQFSKSHSAEAVEILAKFIPETDKKIDLGKALAASENAFGEEENWGMMDTNNVTEFLNWLHENGLESQEVAVADLFTNELL
ncbi:MAG: ABC-type nitrate/sulfonate/bicarbonate transport system substrate-binding protein [Spirosomataceae bacterium]|jgi:ABC-type nitrate/sulfonate/bicarbonate transport system substrate-binding protein